MQSQARGPQTEVMIAYERIKSLLMQPAFLPGEQLKIGHLAQMCDIGYASVREALLILSSEGIIELRPNKGYFTTVPNVNELRGLYTLIRYISNQALSDTENAQKRKPQTQARTHTTLSLTAIPDETKHDLHARRTNALFEAIARLSGSASVIESVQRASFRLHHARRAELDVLEDVEDELRRLINLLNHEEYNGLSALAHRYHERRSAKASAILKMAYGTANVGH